MTFTTLALAATGVACGSGTSTPAQVELHAPGTDEVVGHYDQQTQTYALFGESAKPVDEIDTIFVFEPADPGIGDPGTPDNPRDNDDLVPGDGPFALNVEDGRCWEVTYAQDGTGVFCQGCCAEDECTEICTDVREIDEAAAMHEWRNLDQPEPWPPQ